MLKKSGGQGRGGGVRVVMNKELKLLLKLQKQTSPVQGGGSEWMRTTKCKKKKKKKKRFGWGPL